MIAYLSRIEQIRSSLHEILDTRVEVDNLMCPIGECFFHFFCNDLVFVVLLYFTKKVKSLLLQTILTLPKWMGGQIIQLSFWGLYVLDLVAFFLRS